MGEFDEYLNDIAGLDDGGTSDDTFSNPQNDQQTTDQEDNQQQQQSEQVDQQTAQQDQQAINQTKPGNAQANDQSANQGQGQQPAQNAEAHKPVTRHGSGNFLDKAGNIVTSDGKIIAKAGSERRQFERFTKLAGDHQKTSQQAQQLEQQLREINFLNNVPRQYNLSNEDVAQGLEIARRLKAGDVLGIAREFVAMAAAKGVNISQIVGEKAGDAIDMVALRAMIDERLAPIMQSQRQSTETSEVERQAVQNYERFVSDNEYADIHGDVIVAAAQRNGTSLQVAYNQTRDFAIRNGFDFSIPLGPQIEARQQQLQQQQQRPPSQTQQRPLPSGSASTRGNVVEPPTPQFADPNDDWASIIRNAMKNSNVMTN